MVAARLYELLSNSLDAYSLLFTALLPIPVILRAFLVLRWFAAGSLLALSDKCANPDCLW